MMGWHQDDEAEKCARHGNEAAQATYSSRVGRRRAGGEGGDDNSNTEYCRREQGGNDESCRKPSG